MSDELEPDDDAKLKSMRAVWLQMRDEDPPDSGLAELLAAARTKAETLSQPSWWQRVVALLRRPPVFALATVMILLGGALLIGRTIETSSSPAPPLEIKPDSESTKGRAISTEHLPEAPRPPPVNETPRGPTVSRTAPPPTPPPPPPGQAPRDEALDIKERAFGAVKADTFDQTEAADGALDGRDDAGADLAKQCAAAARRGDCAAVRSLVQRIAPAQRTRVTKDAAVAKCLE